MGVFLCLGDLLINRVTDGVEIGLIDSVGRYLKRLSDLSPDVVVNHGTGFAIDLPVRRLSAGLIHESGRHACARVRRHEPGIPSLIKVSKNEQDIQISLERGHGDMGGSAGKCESKW